MINVEQMQKHVGKLAKRDPDHRFTRVYPDLCQESMLWAAWERIKGNKGSKTAGMDGKTKSDVDETLIHNLSHKLKNGEYRPRPVKRVYIPK
jgi:RNA-directed DNA polymerase